MLEIDISQGRVTGGIDLVALNPLDNFFLFDFQMGLSKQGIGIFASSCPSGTGLVTSFEQNELANVAPSHHWAIYACPP